MYVPPFRLRLWFWAAAAALTASPTLAGDAAAPATDRPAPLSALAATTAPLVPFRPLRGAAVLSSDDVVLGWIESALASNDGWVRRIEMRTSDDVPGQVPPRIIVATTVPAEPSRAVWLNMRASDFVVSLQ